MLWVTGYPNAHIYLLFGSDSCLLRHDRQTDNLVCLRDITVSRRAISSLQTHTTKHTCTTHVLIYCGLTQHWTWTGTWASQSNSRPSLNSRTSVTHIHQHLQAPSFGDFCLYSKENAVKLQYLRHFTGSSVANWSAKKFYVDYWFFFFLL